MPNRELAAVLQLHTRTHARRQRLVLHRTVAFSLLMLALGVTLQHLVRAEARATPEPYRYERTNVQFGEYGRRFEAEI